MTDRLPRRVSAEVVTSNFFEVLQVRLTAGRGFTVEEGRNPAAPAVGVISDRLCRLEFGGAANAMGQTVTVNSEPVTVIGVAPPGFHGNSLMSNVDLWLPGAQRQIAIPASYPKPATAAMALNRPMFLMLIGRLAPGENRDVLESQLEAAHAALVALSPENKTYLNARLEVTTGFDTVGADRKQLRETFTMLLVLASMLLALACANVSNAVLARSTSRAGEIATRLALGASRWAVARMLFIESLLLSLLAGAGALLLAWLVARAIEGTVILPGFSPLDRPVPDWRVVMWAVGLATVTAVGTGLSPMWSVRRADLMLPLRQTGRSHSSGRHRLRAALMAVQVAASVILLVGAGLLVRSIVAKLSVDTGFDTSRVLTFSVNPLLSNRQPEPEFHQKVIDRVRAGSRRTNGVARVPAAVLQRCRSTPWLSHRRTAQRNHRRAQFRPARIL